MSAEFFDHLFLNDKQRQPHQFTKAGGGGDEPRLPSRDEQKHSEFLQGQFTKAWKDTTDEQVVRHVSRHGTYLEFKGEIGYELATKSLEDMRKEGGKGIRLLNVRESVSLVDDPDTGKKVKKKTIFATVFVSHKQRKFFFSKIQKYGNETNSRTGNPKHQNLLAGIADIERGDRLNCFWTDESKLTPKKGQKEWCEAWLRCDGDGEENKSNFEAHLREKKIESKSGWIVFPERLVKAIHVDKTQLEGLIFDCDDIAEFRRVKDSAAFWCELPPREQGEWVKHLLERLHIAPNATDVAICLLDTGVNYGHALLSPILSEKDCQAVLEKWGVSDHDRHGTLMAGVAAYGDLMKCLASQGSVDLHHVLESVKLLPPGGEQTKQELWGDYTQQAVSLAEIRAPKRKRIVCSAITATDARDRGRPTSWSAAIDQMVSGATDNAQRLFIICTGNATRHIPYPESQKEESIHDPAQSWNALTVGAYTELDHLTDPSLAKYKPIALSGELSPYSTSSVAWESKWPIKPEILMEGGNAFADQTGVAMDCDDLSVVSTWWKPHEALLSSFNMTSAATAHAAWFAAQIQAKYPSIWPETVRALMVHSAEWTDALKKQFETELIKANKIPLSFLRVAGYGVPNLEKALGNLQNSLTLIAQAELTPFKKEEKQPPKSNEMHMYTLPWPDEELRQLPDSAEVRMRVTLSYFIEPGPGEVGWEDRYRYSSFGLRFDVKSPSESPEEFLKRINRAARAQDEGHPGTGSASDHWQIGIARDRGSIHSDIWQGTAAELANSGHIAVYPIGGWWKERHHLDKWSKKARYSLIVSILTKETEVDIYTPVAVKLGVKVPVSIAIGGHS